VATIFTIQTFQAVLTFTFRSRAKRNVRVWSEYVWYQSAHRWSKNYCYINSCKAYCIFPHPYVIDWKSIHGYFCAFKWIYKGWRLHFPV